jgi:uncharacterized protein (TIGR03435 family)
MLETNKSGEPMSSMTSRTARALNGAKTLLSATVAVGALVFPLLIGIGSAPASRAQSQGGQRLGQTADNHPKFEAASVKLAGPYNPATAPAVWLGGGPGTGRITWNRVQLSTVITRAYNIAGDQLQGPDWLTTEWYSILATMPSGTSEAQFRLMLQDLLATRFHMVVHRTTKQFPGYELLVAPGGAKLKSWSPDATFLSVAPENAGGPKGLDKDGFPILGPGQRSLTPVIDGIARPALRGSMAGFAKELGFWIRLATGDNATSRIIDRTGLAGEFEFKMKFAVDPSTSSRMPGSDSNEPSGGPTIFAAVEKQLGLRLKKLKNVTEDLLVIEHIDKAPTPN